MTRNSTATFATEMATLPRPAGITVTIRSEDANLIRRTTKPHPRKNFVLSVVTVTSQDIPRKNVANGSAKRRKLPKERLLLLEAKLSLSPLVTWPRLRPPETPIDVRRQLI
jgi:hypothetical protein